MPRLRPRVEKGGRNVKHFCGHLEHSVPARAAHDHAERVRQDGGKFVEELLVHGADHDVTAGDDRSPIDHLRGKSELFRASKIGRFPENRKIVRFRNIVTFRKIDWKY